MVCYEAAHSDILPPDINEVMMQKEILTPPRVPPATLAASIESMHQNKAERASKDNCSICQRYPQWHYTVLLHSWEHLGQSAWQASIERIQHHFG